MKWLSCRQCGISSQRTVSACLVAAATVDAASAMDSETEGRRGRCRRVGDSPVVILLLTVFFSSMWLARRLCQVGCCGTFDRQVLCSFFLQAFIGSKDSSCFF